ncbi:N/A [soil metagenome]
MPAYFASDIHLRLDRPDRAERFARFVAGLDSADSLTIGGDLCDFWYAARQRRADPLTCEGLRALAEFRGRGGELTILPGNHDVWLGPLYEAALGARFVPEPLERVVHGVRVHLVHGHQVGARPWWKAVMESRTFLQGFEALPGPLARRLETVLNQTNNRKLDTAERRHAVVFQRYAEGLAGTADLCLFGHVHRPIDVTGPALRWIVLGGWQERSSFVKVDDRGVEFVIEGPRPKPLHW